ncbi:MAG: hypothetical protein A3F73_13085 [Gallionellales bacterium RIFCSPLOWO2_12_FULL_59_22]|nr:MAG: hypothetical protein A3H99_00800 [Gallionellales bacterium RIFCSPLOWO2_02_FULL_59_110]OGT11909.1 MAG: hypothetical protein A3F73_13085 [Gallionellales bacterium RIFCSPLOWO2_12_FULL_59_22]
MTCYAMLISVIPAQAGIQQKQKSCGAGKTARLPRFAGIFCELCKRPPIPASTNSIIWIPACAGMTK